MASLHALRNLYERWEMCRIEEKHRFDKDMEKVQFLLNQVLGIGIASNLINRALWAVHVLLTYALSFWLHFSV